MRKLWSCNNGEIINHSMGRNTAKRYKSDTIFDNRIAPLVILLICGIVDASVFYSMFSRITYDSTWMMLTQIVGFLFGFDILPIYLGIHFRRFRQGLTKDRFLLIIGLALVILVAVLNIAIRITTIDQMSPDAGAASINFYDTTAQAETTATTTDPVSIALTVFGIAMPILTSIGSFIISFLCYNPLLIRMRKEEEMIEETRDDIRRLEAVINDYNAESDIAEHLMDDDNRRYNEMRNLHRAVVVGYCDYVRQRLKEHLAEPSSNSILSAESANDILNRLDKELACFEGTSDVQEENKIAVVNSTATMRSIA